MDRYTLQLVTLAEANLEEKFSQIPDPDRLTTVIRSGGLDEIQTYSTADVIFISYKQAVEKLDLIVETKAIYTQIVILVNGTVTETMARQFLQYDMWDPNEPTILNRIFTFKQKMLQGFDLELKENQLYTLIDSVPDLIWYKDREGLHIDVNEPFCLSIGKTLDDIGEKIKYRDQGFLMGLTPEEFASGEFACVTTDNIVIKEQTTSLFDETVLIHGKMRQFKTYKTALRGRNGETIGTVGMAHDVTEIWNTHEEFRTVISRLPFPMMILDNKHKMISYNTKFLEFFHFDDEIKDTFDFTAFGQLVFGCDITLAESQNAAMEKVIKHEEKSYHILIEKSEITDVFGEISGYFYIFRDYTKTYEYEEQLRVMAETDELTQIYNRKFVREFFETKLRVFVKEKLSFAVSIIDIDYFKNYNDHYGHVQGDHVIKELAHILKSHSDNEKIFVARFGGEEFIVMAIAKTQGEVKGLLTSLVKSLKLAQIPHEKSSISDRVTMSIGCYYLDELQNDMHLGDLVEIADKYLYTAKEQGRNGVVSNIPENIVEISLEAQKKANFDTLTNTLKPTAMKIATTDVLSLSNSGDKHALFSLDLNDFNNVNNTLGNEFGDFVLGEVGKRLRDVVRQHDLIGRVDGDKFVIFLRNIANLDILMVKSTMLLDTISKDFVNGDLKHTVKGSIGISVYPDHGKTYDELYQNAGIALSQSKKKGKNTVHIFSSEQEKEDVLP